eukprot:11030328-Heterocapsa_arctica.AAC.1
MPQPAWAKGESEKKTEPSETLTPRAMNGVGGDTKTEGIPFSRNKKTVEEAKRCACRRLLPD